MKRFTQHDKWKEDRIKPHRFSEVDVYDFYTTSIRRRLGYALFYLFTFKTIIAYLADVGVIIFNIYNFVAKHSLLGSSSDSENANPNESKYVSFLQGHSINMSLSVRFGIIVGTIVLSFIFLAFEWHRGMRIVASEDISLSFTNNVSYSYYVLRSYAHYCFFKLIENCREKIDKFAFFAFMNFHNWKRLLISELPRTLLNIFNLVDMFRRAYQYPPTDLMCGRTTCGDSKASSKDVAYYFFIFSASRHKSVAGQVWLTSVSVSLWSISILQLLVAFFIYIPLVIKIRGNLKEYCVRKLDRHVHRLVKHSPSNPLKSKFGDIESLADKPPLAFAYYDDAGSFTGSNSSTNKQASDETGRAYVLGPAYIDRNYQTQQGYDQSQMMPFSYIDQYAYDPYMTYGNTPQYPPEIPTVDSSNTRTSPQMAYNQRKTSQENSPSLAPAQATSQGHVEGIANGSGPRKKAIVPERRPSKSLVNRTRKASKETLASKASKETVASKESKEPPTSKESKRNSDSSLSPESKSISPVQHKNSNKPLPIIAGPQLKLSHSGEERKTVVAPLKETSSELLSMSLARKVLPTTPIYSRIMKSEPADQSEVFTISNDDYLDNNGAYTVPRRTDSVLPETRRAVNDSHVDRKTVIAPLKDSASPPDTATETTFDVERSTVIGSPMSSLYSDPAAHTHTSGYFVNSRGHSDIDPNLSSIDATVRDSRYLR